MTSKDASSTGTTCFPPCSYLVAEEPKRAQMSAACCGGFTSSFVPMTCSDSHPRRCS
eukprot:CAMPEP_0185171832 /NCGR_PEP_ID=MMETSP1139-20130426/20682_1 /TAXON_ID=298111 /ORGANISM="Pavlova sp., Strain CCMP459" /LENGTH=56 /DNA_ID=CAMNT_0027737453 /DNA_START=24 /DNA_END=191 /DNA_ORIENTATION=-